MQPMQEGTKCTKQPVAQPGFGGGGAQGVWGTEVPQLGPGAEPLVGGSGEHSLTKAHSSY